MIELKEIIRFIPLTAIVTPATLTVQFALELAPKQSLSHIPAMDWRNAVMFSSEGVGRYSGPNFDVSRVGQFVGTGASIAHIIPLAANSSYTLNFFGPKLECVKGNNSVTQTFLATWGNEHNAFYTSFVPSFSSNLSVTLARVLNSPFEPNTFGGSLSDSFSEDTARVFFAIRQPPIERNTTMHAVECRLYSASYEVDFRFRDGLQSLTV